MSRPAPFLAAVAAQASMEARLTARRGENLLAMIGIPAAVLWYFASFSSGPEPFTRLSDTVSSLIPGALSLAIVASGLVNLGIATSYERGYGVLKRLGGAPLGRGGLLVAKLVVVIAIAYVQVVGLLVFARFALGWDAMDAVSWFGLAVTTLVGIITFAGLGLLLAGTLRPEATLVVANVLFLAAIVLGGAVPVDLRGPLTSFTDVLPPGLLARGFEAALSGGTDLGILGLLALWAVAVFAAAARTFRWE